MPGHSGVPCNNKCPQLASYPVYTFLGGKQIGNLNAIQLASFSGPAQLSVASNILEATESWAGPENEASAMSQVLHYVSQSSNEY